MTPPVYFVLQSTGLKGKLHQSETKKSSSLIQVSIRMDLRITHFVHFPLGETNFTSDLEEGQSEGVHGVLFFIGDFLGGM